VEGGGGGGLGSRGGWFGGNIPAPARAPREGDEREHEQRNEPEEFACYCLVVMVILWDRQKDRSV
jgi:hypothetical protein